MILRVADDDVIGSGWDALEDKNACRICTRDGVCLKHRDLDAWNGHARRIGDESTEHSAALRTHRA
jgi:hypothetical protein